MRKLVLFILIFMASNTGVAKENSDSLWNIWTDETQKPLDRIIAIDQIIYYNYLFVKPDSAFVLAELMYDLAMENNLDKNIGGALMLMGGSYYFRSEYDSALKYDHLALNHFIDIDELSGQASALGNMANILTDQGNFQKGIEYYHRSLTLHESLGNKRGQATQLMNIGLIYSQQSEYHKAIEYYNKCLSIHEEDNFKYGISDCLINLGNAYVALKDYDKGLDLYMACLEIHDQINDGQGKALLHMNIGEHHFRLKEYDRALEYYDLALDIQKDVGDRNGEASSLILKGKVYAKQNNLPKSTSIMEEGLTLAQQVGNVDEIRDASWALYMNFKATGQSRQSLAMFEQYILMRDSIVSEKNQRGLLRQEYKYEYEKQALADSLEFAQKKIITDLKIEKQDADLSKQRLGLAAMTGGLLLVVLLAFSIRKGKKRSDELLHNILPEEVATELKQKGKVGSKRIESVTVLFTDFKGFTAMAEQLSAKDLVKDLNVCFSEFDRIMDKYGIEKIKTIGDAYMAAGGLSSTGKSHAEHVLCAAFEMRDFVAAGKAKKIEAGLPFFEIRIGVHTGPVVAGIVGVKKFQYDIWGDTVNIASRMESSGNVGQVNISQATYELLKDDAEFAFESRGKIEAKGKGEIEMYFVSKA